MYIIDIPNLDLKQIAESGQCFRFKQEDDKTFSVIAFGRYLKVSQEQTRLIFSCDEQEFDKLWRSYFDLDTDYGLLCENILKGEDDFMKRAVMYGSGIRILRQELWEMFISFIISQNNNIPRIKKSIESLCESFGRPIVIEGKVMGYSFPEPEALADLELSELAGLSLGYRDRYIIEASRWYVKEREGIVRELYGMDAVKQKETLKKCVLGIGEKVANCIVLFGLHTLSACPIDTWMKKLIEEDYGKLRPAWMNDEYAGVYQQYAFYYKRDRA